MLPIGHVNNSEMNRENVINLNKKYILTMYNYYSAYYT